MNTHIRTDLAMEAKESLTHTPFETEGIKVEEHSDRISRITITTVQILTENAAASIGKPKGRYVTLESARMEEDDPKHQEQLCKTLAECLKSFCPHKENRQSPASILVVGLGNRNITPDCLGPSAVDKLMISRHLFREYGQSAFEQPAPYLLSAIVPGVMAQTGMESLEIIKGITKEAKPDLCIIIDALASRSIRRLGRTIQISDTGIHPGSGVGNHRNGISEETLGIPVLSLGIPTVVDAATIVFDTLTEASFQESAIHSLLLPSLHSMFVTPKDIDATITRLSTILSEGINLAFGPAM